MTHSLCYFLFPLFEMMSLVLFDEGECCQFVNTVEQLDEIVHISCVCPFCVSISNSLNLFLMNFSRAWYPGQFLRRCTMHLRLVLFGKGISLIGCSPEDHIHHYLVSFCFYHIHYSHYLPSLFQDKIMENV